jgi:hypothetical protein
MNRRARMGWADVALDLVEDAARDAALVAVCEAGAWARDSSIRNAAPTFADPAGAELAGCGRVRRA